MSALVVYPPLRRFKPAGNSKPTVFLAGSIEMGKASDWQAKAIEQLSDNASVIYNPRRPNWDSSWEQKIDHPEFNNQVNWELDLVESVDLVFFYFEPDTLSPISLMELGDRKWGVHVCCPEGYWRKGNVDIFCERNRIPLTTDLDDGLTKFRHACFTFARDA